jgi:hypothetical protein
LRIFSLVDDLSRKCVPRDVDFSVGGERLPGEPDRPARRRKLPRKTVPDNGPDPTNKAVLFPAERTGVKLHLIQPGEPA